MSTHTYAVEASAIPRIERSIADLPPRLILTDETGISLAFVRDLTPEEVTALDLVVESAAANLPTAVYETVRAQMQTLRDFRQLGRNAFMALTAAERDRALYDAQTATTIVLLALLRD